MNPYHLDEFREPRDARDARDVREPGESVAIDPDLVLRPAPDRPVVQTDLVDTAATPPAGLPRLPRLPGLPGPARLERRLRTFTGAGYDKGRSTLWQAAWFATMNLVFDKWWLPPRFRPAILRAFGAQVGERVLIRHRVRVLWPWKLSIGDDCWIGEGAWLLNLEPITIEHDVCVSQEAFLCTGSHRHHDPGFEFDNAPIQVGAGAWIAARSTVLRGTTVAPGEVVPANTVRR